MKKSKGIVVLLLLVLLVSCIERREKTINGTVLRIKTDPSSFWHSSYAEALIETTSGERVVFNWRVADRVMEGDSIRLHYSYKPYRKQETAIRIIKLQVLGDTE